MRPLAITLLALLLTACGGASDEPTAATSSAPTTTSEAAPVETTTSATPAEPATEPLACQLAAAKWVVRMGRHTKDAELSVAMSVTPLDLENLKPLTKEAKRTCSKAVTLPLLDGNYQAALLNARLLICGSVCNGPDYSKARKVLDTLEALVTKVNARI